MHYAAAIAAFALFVTLYTNTSPAKTAQETQYLLPRDKTALESCRRLALTAHPGEIHNIQTEQRLGKLDYRFEIEVANGRLRHVVCDPNTYTILDVAAPE